MNFKIEKKADFSFQFRTKKEVTVIKQSLPKMKSGDYLSSRRFSVSTFGVKELNFCVRNGNRWILFAIITAIVIYLASFSAYATYTNLIKPSFKEDLQLHSKFGTKLKFFNN